MKWDRSKFDEEQATMQEVQYREAKDAAEKRRLIIYLSCSVVGFYLVWAFFAPIFAPMFQQAEHYCAEWGLMGGEAEVCFEYVSDTEESIAHHNSTMVYRNVYLLFTLFALLSLVNWSFLCISRYQVSKDRRPSIEDNLKEAAMYALFTVFAVGLFNNAVLYSFMDMRHGYYPEIFEYSEPALAAFNYHYDLVFRN